MSRKNTLKLQLASTQSLASSFTTNPVGVDNQDNLSFQINCFTTDSIGTFQIEASDDYSEGYMGAVSNPGIWNPLPLGGGTPNVNANDAVIGISMGQPAFAALRVSYTSSTAGTGTCDIFINCKQIGG